MAKMARASAIPATVAQSTTSHELGSSFLYHLTQIIM